MPEGGCDRCPQRNNNKINVITKKTYCEDCFVQLLPENDLFAQVYLICRQQFIYNDNGPVDINNLAIQQAMDLIGIDKKYQLQVFNLVNHLMQKQLKKIQQRSKMKR